MYIHRGVRAKYHTSGNGSHKTFYNKGADHIIHILKLIVELVRDAQTCTHDFTTAATILELELGTKIDSPRFNDITIYNLITSL